jgi:hypothetical protein
VGHDTLGGGWKHVEEMGVGWEVWSWQTIRTNREGGEKCPSYAWSKRFGKM